MIDIVEFCNIVTHFPFLLILLKFIFTQLWENLFVPPFSIVHLSEPNPSRSSNSSCEWPFIVASEKKTKVRSNHQKIKEPNVRIFRMRGFINVGHHANLWTWHISWRLCHHNSIHINNNVCAWTETLSGPIGEWMNEWMDIYIFTLCVFLVFLSVLIFFFNEISRPHTFGPFVCVCGFRFGKLTSCKDIHRKYVRASILLLLSILLYLLWTHCSGPSVGTNKIFARESSQPSAASRSMSPRDIIMMTYGEFMWDGPRFQKCAALL